MNGDLSSRGVDERSYPCSQIHIGRSALARCSVAVPSIGSMSSAGVIDMLEVERKVVVIRRRVDHRVLIDNKLVEHPYPCAPLSAFHRAVMQHRQVLDIHRCVSEDQSGPGSNGDVSISRTV